MRRRWYDVSADSAGFSGITPWTTRLGDSYFPTVNSSSSGSIHSTTKTTMTSSSSSMGQLYRSIVEQGWIPFHNMICSQLKCMYMKIGFVFAIELSRRSCVQGLGHVTAAKRCGEIRIEHESIARCSQDPQHWYYWEIHGKTQGAAAIGWNSGFSGKLDSLVKRPRFPEFKELVKRSEHFSWKDWNRGFAQAHVWTTRNASRLRKVEKKWSMDIAEELTPLLRVPASEDCQIPLSLDELPVTPTIIVCFTVLWIQFIYLCATRRFLQDEFAVVRAIRHAARNRDKKTNELFRKVEEQREIISQIMKQERDFFARNPYQKLSCFETRREVWSWFVRVWRNAKRHGKAE